MTSAMKKVEIFAEKKKCEEIYKILEEKKIYWYSDKVLLRGDKEVCHVLFYAPRQILPDVIAELQSALDLRKKENAIIILDVEHGSGRPYKLTSRRFLEEAKRLLQRPPEALMEEAEERSILTPTAAILVLIAGVVALAGLAANNPYTIIGAMLISPILGPIYSFSVSVTLGRPKTALRSLKTLLALIGLAVLSGFMSSAVVSAAGYTLPATSEILSRARPGAVDIVLALLLGSASVVAVTSETVEALTGVAIAAAIIPPASALGWSLALSRGLALGLLGTLTANLVGLLVGGTMMLILLLAPGKVGLGRVTRLLGGAPTRH
ncbi:MAG: TIGR00341 family protein [Desulfurococcales archaeon]|nr:TIGR00341 family protein [Desulfurococcales archaeon]